MRIQEFNQYFKKDQGQFRTKLFTLGGIAFAVLGIFFGSLYYVSGQGSRLAIAEAEITKEKEFINQYRQEEQRYRDTYGASAQPVAKNEIEIIQNDLIQKTKNYQLNVISLNNVTPPVVQNPATSAQNTSPNSNSTNKTPAPADGVEFEMGFVGTWEMSVKYIQDLQKNSGLLSIRNFSMKPRASASNLVETSLKYKIYLQ